MQTMKEVLLKYQVRANQKEFLDELAAYFINSSHSLINSYILRLIAKEKILKKSKMTVTGNLNLQSFYETVFEVNQSKSLTSNELLNPTSTHIVSTSLTPSYICPPSIK